MSWVWPFASSTNSANSSSMKNRSVSKPKPTHRQQHARRMAFALSNVTLISIAGGRRDNLVDQRLTSVSDMVLSDRGFSVLTHDIPGVSMSVDHQCLVWCKQLLFSITSGLYAAMDIPNGRMHRDPEIRMQAFSKFLLPKDWAENS